ncbi:MAG: hypothetical protein KJ888_20285, partial [Gammaproteobacteria bacterium]|nr:hypothetical protein [Gammaproteobacteria bacterium]
RNGIEYHDETPEAVIKILEDNLRNHRQERLRLYYGDSETGLDWEEVYDVTGYVGHSTGTVKIPLLVHNARSLGGSPILDHCIVKITKTTKPYKVLYQHPKYHLP